VASALDRRIEAWTRALARRSSRRSFLARLARVLLGAAALPLLPVARGAAQGPDDAGPDDAGVEGPAGDPRRCEYWRYCSIDGFLSACCGGTQASCPPGTAMSLVTWIGTCRNPADGRDYVISYNDCCGQSFCGRCACNRNEGDKPVYMPSRSNEINWCMGTESAAYHSTVAIVLGPVEVDGA
jgi:methylamine dehydrogenase light chain